MPHTPHTPQNAPPRASVHTTTFHRHPVTGEHRARCSCGWFHFGTLQECQTQAAIHDIEWEPVDTAPTDQAIALVRP